MPVTVGAADPILFTKEVVAGISDIRPNKIKHITICLSNIAGARLAWGGCVCSREKRHGCCGPFGMAPLLANRRDPALGLDTRRMQRSQIIVVSI